MDRVVDRGSRRAAWADRMSYLGFLAGLSFLLFVLGALAAYRDWPAARYVRHASLAAQALVAQGELSADRYPKYLWFPAVHSERGLTRRDAARSQPGYTLYSSGHKAQVTLLDETGNVVHCWEAPFSRVWPDARHVRGWVPDRSVAIRRAHVFPNGDLLALYESPLHTPSGCGLARLDRHGDVKWRLDENAHHDFSLGPGGRIVVLTHEVSGHAPANWEQLVTPFVEEFVTVLTPDGEVVQRLSLFEMLGRSPFHRPLVTHADQMGDVLHSNTVRVIGPGFASRHEGVAPGDVMVCLRNVNLVVVVDLRRESIGWAMTGPWRLPHDSDPLPDGSMLIFDNCFARGTEHGSRVIRFDPRTGAVRWQYAGGEAGTLRSDIRSCQQLLPNANVLITESDRGRLIEVSPAGRVVWEYVNPVRGGDHDELIPIVTGARRYRAEEVPFVEHRGVASGSSRRALHLARASTSDPPAPLARESENDL